MIRNQVWQHLFVGSCRTCNEPTVLHYRKSAGVQSAEWSYIEEDVGCPRTGCGGIVVWLKLVAIDEQGGAERMDLRNGRTPR